ncbi:MAG: hypothetical protein CBC84_001815 [Pelagibacteraceae bacterium TMED124]|nr:MAG: hypothetical protein CBC84_001815 [Pelagibacteraceae bacterium TMED124]
MRYFILKGGLGNQLFQLSAFFYLRDKYNLKDLKLDLRTGFWLDYKYKRFLQISNLRNCEYSCSKIISIQNFILLIIHKRIPFINNFLKILFINDKSFKKINKRKLNKNQYCIFDGYFQNSKYVIYSLKNIMSIVSQDIDETPSALFKKLYDEIKIHKNSVALCIRFYEETDNPLLQTNQKVGLKSVSEFNEIISEIEKKLENPKFFIFVQKENSFTDQLKFKSKKSFITHDLGFKCAWNRLRAQSYCKHHIFNNSTFYFWGSIFSDQFYNSDSKKSVKYVSNNFIFKEIYLKNMTLF